jgi:glycosyltransferase involved in cell wall biosynthesis
MLKLLFIDPWGINGLEEYTDNLINNISNYNIEILYVSNFYSQYENVKIIKKHYFKYSEKNNFKFRFIFRFFEYIINQITLIFISYKYKPDILHIQWSLFFLIDIPIVFILKLLFPNTKFIFTLHNLSNHTFNDKKLRLFFASLFDYIIVHGKCHFKELSKYRNLNKKIILMHHGNKKLSSSIDYITPIEINNYNFKNKKVFLFFGHLKSNKGINNLINSFIHNDLHNTILIIAGKEHYSTKYSLLKIPNHNNIIFIKRFITNSEKNYLFTLSDLILLPYLTGSLSGVFFTASSFSKPCLTTNFGNISDYIINSETSFLENNYNTFETKLIELTNYPKTYFNDIGKNNLNYVNINFSWEIISNYYFNFYNKIFNE